jgi:hypothetical protein
MFLGVAGAFYPTMQAVKYYQWAEGWRAWARNPDGCPQKERIPDEIRLNTERAFRWGLPAGCAFGLAMIGAGAVVTIPAVPKNWIGRLKKRKRSS